MFEWMRINGRLSGKQFASVVSAASRLLSERAM